MPTVIFFADGQAFPMDWRRGFAGKGVGDADEGLFPAGESSLIISRSFSVDVLSSCFGKDGLPTRIRGYPPLMIKTCDTC